jgi:hypothetical protein
MIARKAKQPFRGAGILASGCEVKTFPVQIPPPASQMETIQTTKLFEKSSRFRKDFFQWVDVH